MSEIDKAITELGLSGDEAATIEAKMHGLVKLYIVDSNVESLVAWYRKTQAAQKATQKFTTAVREVAERRAAEADGFVRYRVGWDWFEEFQPDVEEYAVVTHAAYAQHLTRLAEYNAKLEKDIDWRADQSGSAAIACPNTGERISITEFGGDERYSRMLKSILPPYELERMYFFPTGVHRPDWEETIIWRREK